MLDYKEMFLFAHLEELYRGRAWAIVDAGPKGSEIVDRLRKSFSGWPASRFAQWSQLDFERYYPDEFSTQVDVVLSEKDKQKKRELKEELVKKVVAWILEDEALARSAFEVSAAEVIAKLQEIENDMASMGFGQGIPAPVPQEPPGR